MHNCRTHGVTAFGASDNNFYLDNANNGTINFRGQRGDPRMSLSSFGITLAKPVTLASLSSDSGHTDNSLCADSSTGLAYKGSGTGGACLGTSSRRYKHAIRDMGDGLVAVAQLRPINFRYNKGYGDGGERDQYGFTAEDVATVLPALVHTDADGRPNSVDYVGLIPLLVNAIKALVLWSLALTAGFLWLGLVHFRLRRKMAAPGGAGHASIQLSIST